MKDSFGTESHARELDIIYGIQPADFKEEYSKTCKSFNHFKTEWRFIRKYFSSLFRKTQKNNDFKTILYLTLDIPPLDFISAFRQQYPDKDIKVLIPVDNTDDAEKLVFDFEYYLQNRTNNASLYKMKPNSLNIDVYGLYSEAFSGFDRSRLQYLAPFVKAARIAAQKLKPKIIHSNNIPFFLGVELGNKSHYPIKVLQIINDFSKFEAEKEEAFWAAVNLADSKGMKKLCSDKIIKKCNDDTEIIIHMSDFTGFEWDKCIVYGPSTQTKDICDAFDINYNTYLDLNYGIIFLNNNNVTYEEFFKVSDHDFTNKIPEFIIYPYRQNESTQVKYASFEKNEAEFKCIKKDSDNGYYYRLYPIN